MNDSSWSTFGKCHSKDEHKKPTERKFRSVMPEKIRIAFGQNSCRAKKNDNVKTKDNLSWLELQIIGN